MKYPKFISTLLLSLFPAMAQNTQTLVGSEGAPMETSVLECFRQNEFFVLCNVSLKNTSDSHMELWPALESFSIQVGGETLPGAALSVAGTEFDDRPRGSVKVIVPKGQAILLQVKFQPPKTVKQLDGLNFSTAKFGPVPLTEEPWEPHTLNPVAGEPSKVLSGEGYAQSVLSCYRLQKNDVRCLTVTQNTTQNPSNLSLRASAVFILGTDGIYYPATGMTLGEKPTPGNEFGNTLLPTDVAVAGYSTFSLPQTVQTIPTLIVGSLMFHNIPIEVQDADLQFTLPAGQAVLETRNDQLRSKLQGCRWMPEKTNRVQCDFLFKSADRQAHRLSIFSRVLILTPAGLWTEGDPLNDEDINIPMEDTVQGSVVFDFPAQSSQVPYLEVGGLVFRNLPLQGLR